jgi:hypothetical protein
MRLKEMIHDDKVSIDHHLHKLSFQLDTLQRKIKFISGQARPVQHTTVLHDEIKKLYDGILERVKQALGKHEREDDIQERLEEYLENQIFDILSKNPMFAQGRVLDYLYELNPWENRDSKSAAIRLRYHIVFAVAFRLINADYEIRKKFYDEMHEWLISFSESIHHGRNIEKLKKQLVINLMELPDMEHNSRFKVRYYVDDFYVIEQLDPGEDENADLFLQCIKEAYSKTSLYN